jgi:hypothetical protein
MSTPRAKPGPKPRLAPEQRGEVMPIRLSPVRQETLRVLGVASWLAPILDAERERLIREGLLKP